MTKIKMDYNSNVNQEIKARFVARQVLTCFSYEMEAILRAGSEHQSKDYPLPSYDEIENGYEQICPSCGSDDLAWPEPGIPNEDICECSCRKLTQNFYTRNCLSMGKLGEVNP